jgi:hypothetical protein
MHIRASERDGNHDIAGAVRDVVDHLVSMAKLELRLALTEVRRRLAVVGVGLGLAAGAALLGILALVLAVATVAAAIATALPVWASLLILTGACGALASVFALTAVGLLRRASPPLPRQAIDEARRTAEALRSNGRA